MGLQVPYVAVYVPLASVPAVELRLHVPPAFVHPSGHVYVVVVFVSPVGQQYLCPIKFTPRLAMQFVNDRHRVGLRLATAIQGGVKPTTNANGRLSFIKCFIIVSPDCLLNAAPTKHRYGTSKKPSKFDGQEVRNNHKELCAYSVRVYCAHYSQPS